MLYQPKYCCNCGEKIERTKWQVWSSRKFCQLCETDFSLQEWTPRLIVILGMVFGIVGFAGYFQDAEKPLNVAALRSPQPASEAKKNPLYQKTNEKVAASTNVRVPLENSANTNNQAQHQNAAAAKQTTSPKALENQASVVEASYFCGAETKKGKPCSRRVKNVGRCWQHAGQPAVLPPDKLIVDR